MGNFDLIVADFPAQLFLDLHVQVEIEIRSYAFSFGIEQKELHRLLFDRPRISSMKPLTIFAVPKELDECSSVFSKDETHYLYFIPLDKETLQKKLDRIKILGAFL
jgi:hypothetical protein